MIQKSEKLYNIDLRQSYIIGDRTADIKCGENANLKTILVKTGHAGKDLKYNIKPNFIFNNFTEAINHIL